ncbi:MAG: tetratricopeptide repeat protein [Bacteroidetes bacterium]|nr:tetratricopeptide repeat protein [Bacteroidota bacterium]
MKIKISYFSNLLSIILIIAVITPLLMTSCSKSPQELKEESEKLFLQASDLYGRGYYRQAQKYFLRLLEIDLELKNSQRVPNIYVYLGLISYNRGDFKMANQYYSLAENEFRKQFNKKGEALALNNIAGVNAILGMYDSAETAYKNVLSLSLLSADKEAEAIAHVNLASLYKEIYKTHEALRQYQKAYDAYNILNDYRGKIFIANKIGELHLHSGNLISALESFDFALGINSKINSNYLYASIFNNIGLAYFSQGEFILAFESFNTAADKNKLSERDEYLDIIIKINLGDAAFELKQFSKAREYFISALSEADLSFFKYLSPYIQVKIGECDLKLGELLNDNKSISSAETYFKYALKRFEEGSNYQGQKIAISRLINLYQNSGQKEKFRSLLRDNEKLPQSRSFKFKEWSYSIAKNFEDESSINLVKAYIKEKNINSAFKTLLLEQTFGLRQYFLRFNNFDFLVREGANQVNLLKKEIHKLKSYEEMLIKELSLPSAQRDKDKVELLEEQMENSKDKTDKLLKELKLRDEKKYSFLFDDSYDPLNIISKIDPKKIYVEFVPLEKELLIFLISQKGVDLLKSDITKEDFDFLTTDLYRNFSRYSIDEHKKISGKIFNDTFEKIRNRIFGYSELIVLMNEHASNFYPHLLYSPSDKKYFNQLIKISYGSNFLGLTKTRSSENLIIQGKSRDEIFSNEFKSLQESRLEFELFFPGQVISKSVDNVFVLANLILNSRNPNTSYVEINFDASADIDEQLPLSKLFNLNAENLYVSEILSDNLSAVQYFNSIFNLLDGKCIIFPVTKKEEESSKFFLYNYARGLKDNLREETFFNTINLMMENPKYSHQKFWGNYLFLKN